MASLAELAEIIPIDVAPSADVAADVTAGVASSADLAEVGVASSADLAGDVTIGVASLAELAEVITVAVAPTADLAGDVTAGVASLADLAEVITAGVAPSADPDGDVTAGVTSMEEYKERDVVLSDVVLPQTDPDELSAELETIVVGAPLALLWDTADCSPAYVAPVTYPDLANPSPGDFPPATFRN